MTATLTHDTESLDHSEAIPPASERRNWIDQQRQVIETEMRALWFSTGFTLIGLFVAVALLYLNRM